MYIIISCVYLEVCAGLIMVDDTLSLSAPGGNLGAGKTYLWYLLWKRGWAGDINLFANNIDKGKFVGS